MNVEWHQWGQSVIPQFKYKIWKILNFLLTNLQYLVHELNKFPSSFDEYLIDKALDPHF
jgi:hypothetical protein